jgi:hypothetical protein
LLNLRRVAIIAKESGNSLSKMLKVEDDYLAFCVDELGVYLATVWRDEKPYKQKVIEQNKMLMSKADKLKNNMKEE